MACQIGAVGAGSESNDGTDGQYLKSTAPQQRPRSAAGRSSSAGGLRSPSLDRGDRYGILMASDDSSASSTTARDFGKDLISEQTENLRMMMIRLNQKSLDSERRAEDALREKLVKAELKRREERDRQESFARMSQSADQALREVEETEKRLSAPPPTSGASQAERSKLIAQAKAKAALEKKLRNEALGIKPVSVAPSPASVPANVVNNRSSSSGSYGSTVPAGVADMPPPVAPLSSLKSTAQNDGGGGPLGITKDQALWAALAKAKKEARLAAAEKARVETAQKEARLNALIMAAEEARLAKEREAQLHEQLELDDLDAELENLADMVESVPGGSGGSDTAERKKKRKKKSGRAPSADEGSTTQPDESLNGSSSNAETVEVRNLCRIRVWVKDLFIVCFQS